MKFRESFRVLGVAYLEAIIPTADIDTRRTLRISMIMLYSHHSTIKSNTMTALSQKDRFVSKTNTQASYGSIFTANSGESTDENQKGERTRKKGHGTAAATRLKTNFLCHPLAKASAARKQSDSHVAVVRSKRGPCPRAVINVESVR